MKTISSVSAIAVLTFSSAILLLMVSATVAQNREYGDGKSKEGDGKRLGIHASAASRGGVTANSHVGLSPFPMPSPTDTRFSVDTGYGGLDTTCTYRSEGSLKSKIAVKTYVGPVKADGTPIDPQKLKDNGVISEFAILRMPVLAFAVQCGTSATLARAQGRVDVIRFPDYWTRIDSEGREIVLPAIIYKIWRLPGKDNGELLFGGAIRGQEGLTVGYGGKQLKQEWAGPIPDAAEKRYSMNFFAVSFGESSPRVRKLSEKEHLIGEPVLNGYHYISADQQRIDVFKNSPSSLRYAGKLFAKSGRAWSDIVGMVSPGGRWLAVFSYTSPGKRTKSHGVFDDGGEPERGIAHVDIYNAASGEKVLAAKHAYRAETSSMFNDSVWVKEQYLVIPLDFNRRICLLLTLPGEQREFSG